MAIRLTSLLSNAHQQKPRQQVEGLREAILAVASITDILRDMIGLDVEERDQYKINCPAPDHLDENPSCSVDNVKNRFRCFSCGAGGDIFNLVQMTESCSFRDALYKLARYYHIETHEDAAVSFDLARRQILSLQKKLTDNKNNTVYTLLELDEAKTHRAASHLITKWTETLPQTRKLWEQIDTIYEQLDDIRENGDALKAFWFALPEKLRKIDL